MEKNRNWVLIRGLIRGHFHWHSFPKKLAEIFPNDSIHLFDLPGNGERNKDYSPMDIGEYTDDIRYQARKLENIHVIAISLGGMTALDWIAHHPKEVASAFIINTSLGDSGPFYKRLNYLTYPKLARSFFESSAAREKLILDITANNLKVHEDVLAANIAFAEKYPTNRANFFRQMLAASRTQFNSRLSQFNNLHFITSRNDRLVNCENTYNLCQRLNLKPHIHPWAGHDLTLDDPAFFLTHCFETLTASKA